MNATENNQIAVIRLRAKMEKCRTLYMDAVQRDSQGEIAAALESMRTIARRLRVLGAAV